MAAPIVRADYDQLTQVASQFGQQAEQVTRALQQIKSQVDILQGGDWLGTGAQAFYAEMNGQVVPTLSRLARALEAARTTTLQVRQAMKVAEDEAARRLQAQPSAAARAAGPAGPASAAVAARPTVQDIMKKLWGSGSGGGVLGSIGGFFSSVAGGIKDFAIGVVSEGADMVKGLAHAVTHPIETIKGLAYAVTHPIQTAKAIAQPFIEAWESGHPFQAIGRGVLAVGTLFLGGAGAVKGVRAASAAAEAAEAASVAGRVARVASVAGETAEVAGTAARVASVAGESAEAASVAAESAQVAEMASVAGESSEVAGQAARVATAEEAAGVARMAEGEVAVADDAGGVAAQVEAEEAGAPARTTSSGGGAGDGSSGGAGGGGGGSGGAGSAGSGAAPVRSWDELVDMAENRAQRQSVNDFRSEIIRDGNREVRIIEGQIGDSVTHTEASMAPYGYTQPGEHATHSVGMQLGENLPEGLTSAPGSFNLSEMKIFENSLRETADAAAEFGATVETRTIAKVEYVMQGADEIPVLVGIQREASLVVPGTNTTIPIAEFEANLDPVTRNVVINRNRILRPE